MPSVIVLDEPNANLDAVGEQALVQAVAAMKQARRTVVIVTHKTDILGLVDTVLVMNEGAVQLAGPRDEVLASIMGPRVVDGAARARPGGRRSENVRAGEARRRGHGRLTISRRETHPQESDMSVIEAPLASSDCRTIAMAGYAVIVTCIGGLFLWASVTKLDSAVVANASVSLDSRRKVVQHLEGGIIKQINVKEGQLVAEEGEVLIRLDDTQARARPRPRAQPAGRRHRPGGPPHRQRDVAPEVAYPAELTSRASTPGVQKIIDDQNAQFRERRNSLRSQVDVLESRVHQLETEIEGLKREGAAAEQQLYFINDELVGVRDLADKGLVAKTRRNALEREKARLDGVIGRNQIDKSKARNNINEVRLQVNQLQQKAAGGRRRLHAGDAAEDVGPAREDPRVRGRAAPDRAHRLAGRHRPERQGQHHRPGAAPGESLLEIVPTDDQLVVEAQVPVTDVDRLQTGATARSASRTSTRAARRS